MIGIAVTQNLVQSIFAIIGFPLFIISAYGLLKEVLLLFLTVYTFKRRKINYVDVLIFLNLLVSVYFFFYSNVTWIIPIEAKIMDLRSYVVVFLIFLLGANMTDYLSYPSFLKSLVPLLWFIILVGLIEYFFIPRDFYMTGFLKTQASKGVEIDSIDAFSYEVEFAGVPFKRMMSVFFNPLNFSYFLILPIFFFFVQRNQLRGKEKWLFLALTICMVLTITRAVIASVIVGVFLYFLILKPSFIKLSVFVVLTSLFLILTPLNTVLTSTLSADDASTIGHEVAKLQAIDNFLDNPNGYGLGTAGAIALHYGDGQRLGGETLFFSIGVTRGWIGLLLFLLLVFFVNFRISRTNTSKLNKYSFYLASVAFTLASIPTEVWLGYQAGFLFWFVGGLLSAKDS